jgi:hypothetical protein
MTSDPFPFTDAPHEAQDAGNEADREPFTPDTADKADWLIGKIADARQRAARVRENAEAIARQHEAEADGLLWQFGAALQEFARKETDRSKRRSVRLLNGQIGFRTKPAAFTVADDVAALVWVRENLPAVLRLDKRAFADVLAVTEEGNAVHGETGERLPFVAVMPAEDVFFVK